MKSAISTTSSAKSQWSVEESFNAQKTLARLYSALPAAQPPTSNSTKVEGYALHPSTINADVLKAKYAVRGELYNRAQELAAEGRDIIYTNGRW